MTIGTGQVSLSDVIAEHGGSYSNASLSNYYRGGASHYVYSAQTNIPASGQISLSQFRGTSRMGYYPMVSVGYWNAGAGVAQYGWNRSNNQGNLYYNYRYRGYNLLFILWQSNNTFQIAIDQPNVPQGILTNMWTPTYGWVGFTYVANFFGYTVWNCATGTTNAFPDGYVEIILQ